MIPGNAKKSAVASAQELLKYCYTPTIKRIADATGFRPHLRNIYNSVDLPHKEIQTLSIDDVSIQFETQTAKEANTFIENQLDEKPVITDLFTQLSDEDVFYDIGAKFGTYSCLVKAAKPTTNVHAFEPSRGRTQRLNQTADLNNTDITVHPVALGNEQRTAKLSRKGQIQQNDGTEQAEEIDIVQGDDYIQSNAPTPNVVKIDVEGKEGEVIDGLQETLSSEACRLVYCEVHPEEPNVSEENVHNGLRNVGFSSITELGSRRSVYFIRATKK